jgi:hypothetical protein
MDWLKINIALVTLLGSVAASPALARQFTVDVAGLKPSIVLPLDIDTIEVAPPFEQIEKRVSASQTDSRVEPLFIHVPLDDDERAALALRIARPKKYRALTAMLDREVDQVQKRESARALNNNNNPNNSEISNQNEDRTRFARILVRPSLLRLLSPEAMAGRLKRRHQRVVIDSAGLMKSAGLRSELLTQLAPFSSTSDLRKIAEKLRTGASLDVDSEILPSGPRRAVRNFEFFRGPNCFMTALAFQYPRMVRSQLVNIREEDDHHQVMINNDELWRVLQSSFYEVDPSRSSLKFGDMLVFFQLPQGGGVPRDSAISYRWLKHASTYLFNGLVYSKGSKSPNSPYVVGYLQDEWKSWQKHVTNGGGTLGVKVFRKPLKSATTRPPKSLDDWMY